MKHIYALVAALMVGTASFAQLPDGSIAPDFTATDINGVEHNLYDLLAEGKKVIVDFSATWCGPCWSYHESEVLKDLYETYGPDGTDELRIFWIESDDANTTAVDLNGATNNSYGDWVTGTPFPIIDNGQSIYFDYACNYLPTIYTVCPNGVLTETGQASVANHHAIFSASSCTAEPHDPGLVSYTGGTTNCPGVETNISVEMMNQGSEVLSAATIEVSASGTNLLTYEWSGSMQPLQSENINVGTIPFDEDTDFDVTITSSDDNSGNNTVTASFASPIEATSLIKVEIMVDPWPQEVGWSITDDMGNVVESVAQGSIAGDPEEVFVWWVSVPATGCYAFEITDSYGDGMNGSLYGYNDGYCSVKSYNDDIVYISTIYDYNGSYTFDAESALTSVTTMTVGLEEQTLSDVTRVFPNPFVDQTNVQFTTSEAAEAALVVYNLVGEQVINDNLGTLPAGEHNHVLDFNGVTAGIYLVTLNAGGQTTTMRVTLK